MISWPQTDSMSGPTVLRTRLFHEKRSCILHSRIPVNISETMQLLARHTIHIHSPRYIILTIFSVSTQIMPTDSYQRSLWHGDSPFFGAEVVAVKILFKFACLGERWHRTPHAWVLASTRVMSIINRLYVVCNKCTRFWETAVKYDNIKYCEKLATTCISPLLTRASVLLTVSMTQRRESFTHKINRNSCFGPV